jgi:predicted metalloendopeptidase
MNRLAILALLLAGMSGSALDPMRPSPVERAYMDTTIRPCEDFYRFANGAYDRVPIPGDYAAYGVNQEIDERNWRILRGILESAAGDLASPEGSPLRRIGDFYRSGMDAPGIQAAGLQPLAEDLRIIAAVDGPKTLAKAVAWLHSRGVSGGFTFSIGVDDKNSSAMVAKLTQDGLGLPERDYYFKDDAATKSIRAAYSKHIARMLELAGEAPAAARAGAERILALEVALAKASRTLTELRNPESNYHRVERDALALLAPEFPWADYFGGIGMPVEPKALVVGQPAFLKAFSRLVRTTPASDWRQYLTWHLLRSISGALPEPFEAEAFAFYDRTLQGTAEMMPRWKRVLQAADRALGEDLGQLYVQTAFSPEAKRQVLEMVDYHKQALRLAIRRATWMGEATRTQALRKLDSMNAKVGFPDRWRDYSAAGIGRQVFAANVLAARTFEFRRRMAKLGRPVDRGEWLIPPQTNNAYYEPTLNEICLPAGILQPPFFDPSADPAANYGALASTIGHEILHGFDDEGSQYDWQGNLRNWWTAEDRKAYNALTARVVKQYDGYEPLPGLKIRGKQTLGENLADIGGLRISFEAWKLATAGKPQPARDGLSSEQRFFVAFAQGWRTNERPERLRLMVGSDVHSPIRWRVNGPVSTLAEFQRAFGCTGGSPKAFPRDLEFSIW